MPRITAALPDSVSPIDKALMYFEKGTSTVPVYGRKTFSPGQKFNGPALIVDDYTTVLLTKDFTLQVDTLLNLILEEKLNSN